MCLFSTLFALVRAAGLWLALDAAGGGLQAHCQVSHPLLLPCRGAAERVCRRWRRLALCLPCTFKLHVSKFGPFDVSTAQHVLQCLHGRVAAAVELVGDPSQSTQRPQPDAWALLSTRLLPPLHR